jgi:hypothetical protein
VPTTLTAADELTGWTVTTYGSAQVQLDTVYRDLTGETNKYAVTFTANNAITQKIIDERRARLRWDTPYYLQVAVYRASSCDGTLTLALGDESYAVAMSTLNDSAWNVVRMPLDLGCYLKNFNKDDLSVSITLASRTTGTLHLDDVVMGPFTQIDGLWYAPVGGATAFKIDDRFDWTDVDTASSRGWLWALWRAGAGVNFASAATASATRNASSTLPGPVQRRKRARASTTSGGATTAGAGGCGG